MLKNARFNTFLLSAAALAPLSLDAALPELSSLEPLEFDEASQRLVARGDARLDYGDSRVRADRITYYQEFALADAEGNVSVTHDGRRLLADRVSFDVGQSVFSTGFLKTGQWPFNLTGVSAGGTVDNISVQGTTVYYGEPGPFTPSVSASEVEYVRGQRDYVRMDNATLRVGRVPVFYLPGYTYYLNDAPYYFDIGSGQNDELGTHIQTTVLFPFSSFLRLGTNLDFYAKRGVLAGPVSQYFYDAENQQIVGAISTGYINDQGDASERGSDRLNQPVDKERGFAEWRHRHKIGERISFTAVASYWSDSEVTRDFREDSYSRSQSPTSFAEAAYSGDNFIISAFGQFRPNNFLLTQERLPEVRFDMLPVQMLGLGEYHQASASYVQLREDSPFWDIEGESDRIDLTYRLERPLHLTRWLTFTPLAGVRYTEYMNQAGDPVILGGAPLQGDQFGREIYEYGFDLEMQAYSQFDTVNRTWGVDGLRHILRPVVRYRYFSDPDDSNEIAAIDREVFNLERPTLNLNDLRNIDEIEETHLARFGLENLFQTRAEGYGSRTLAALNFYQDVLFEKGTRYDGTEQESFNASWVEVILAPAPWLKFELASRFRTESVKLEELRTRTTLQSGEIWELGLSTDLLDKRIDQYRLDFIYRFNERYSLLSDMRIDADTGEFTRFSLGLTAQLGSTWEVLYAITFREDAARESDFEFGIKLRLTDPQF